MLRDNTHLRTINLLVHSLPLHPHNHSKAGQPRGVSTSRKGDQPPILRLTAMKDFTGNRNTSQGPR